MMLFKLSKSSKVKRILLVTLSNVGDVILTFPVVDALCAAFPDAELHVVVGPKARAFFDGNPCVVRVIPYDKKMTWREKLSWFAGLRRSHFDLIVDLRNSMLPFLLDADVVTAPVFGIVREHRKEKHLARLASVVETKAPLVKSALFLSMQTRMQVLSLVQGWENYVLVAPGAADHRKRWGEDGFLKVVRHCLACGRRVVLVGDGHDAPVAGRIASEAGDGVIDLCGRTQLLELAGVIERASLALTNDSGIMHLASYMDKPVVALFGPTDPFFYGPWSRSSAVVRKGMSMEDISFDDVRIEVDKCFNAL